jgi:two-component system cell cycle response regulator
VVEEELLARVRNLIENKQLLDQVERQRKRLKELAHTDQLTSLLNRHCIVDVVPQLIQSTIKRKQYLSVIIVDVDHIKSINDEHGHSTGDVVLAETGRLLKEWCEPEDLAIRFGGEEFVLVLPDCSSRQAQKRAQALRQAIIDLKPEGISITASFGVTTAPARRLSNFETLFEIADKAVYKAKETGRNRVVFTPVSGSEKSLRSPLRPEPVG